MAENKKRPSPATPAGSETSKHPSPDPAAASPMPTSPARPAAKFGGRALLLPLLLLLLLIAIGGGGYLTWPHWYSKVREYAPQLPSIEDARVGGLANRVQALELRVAAPVKDVEIVRMEAERKKLTDAVSRLLDRVKSLENAIGAVKEMAKAAATAEEAARTSADLKRLNDRLTRIESRGGEPAPPTAAFEKRIADVETATADQRKSLEVRVGEAIIAIERRIESLAAEPPAPISTAVSIRPSATALAVAQLRRAAESGRPYLSDLQSLTVVLGDDPKLQPELAVLSSAAATGIATIDALRREFDALAGELATKAAGDGWVARAVARLSSLVRVRRIDGRGDPNAPDTIVAGAEASLAAGDLVAAVAAVERLAAAQPQAVAAAWLARAKARLAVETALNAMHAYAVSALTQPTPASPAKE